MKEVFEIDFEIDRKAYASVIRKRLFCSKRMILTFILACLSGILLTFGGQMVYGISITAALILAILVRGWIAPSRWLRTAPYLTEGRTLRFTPDRIFLETSSVKSEFPWNHFIAWNESSEYFMLDLTAEGYCSVIPKSAMNAEQQDLFRSWAAANLPKFPGKLKRK